MLKHYFNRWESLQEEMMCYLFMSAKIGLHALGRILQHSQRSIESFCYV